LGLVVTNLVNTYRWNLDELVHRPGTALFTQDEQEADFTPRPASQAPEELLPQIRDFRFGPRLALGAGRLRGDRLRLFSQLDLALGRSSGVEPGFEVGVGAELQATPSTPLQAHASLLSGGARLGGGAGFQWGRVRIAGAASWVSGGAEGASGGMLTVSLGGW
jgi:hypothetical protein